MIFTQANNIIPRNKIAKMNLFFTQKDIYNKNHPIHSIQHQISTVKNEQYNINRFRIYKHTKIGVLNNLSVETPTSENGLNENSNTFSELEIKKNMNENNYDNYQFQNYIYKNKLYSDLKDEFYKNKIKKLKIREPVKISSWHDCGDRMDEIKERIKELKIKKPVEKSNWIEL